MDTSFGEKVNKETQASNDTLDQTDVTDIYKTFHPEAAEYTFFSSAGGRFSRTDDILGYKSSPGKFNKKAEIVSDIFSDYSTVR